jgi:hypothetical protein
VSAFDRNQDASSDHLLAAGVVEVLARRKDLDRFGAPLDGLLQQPGVQALVQEQVCRQNAQLGHRLPRAGSMESANPAPIIVAFLQ